MTFRRRDLGRQRVASSPLFFPATRTKDEACSVVLVLSRIPRPVMAVRLGMTGSTDCLGHRVAVLPSVGPLVLRFVYDTVCLRGIACLRLFFLSGGNLASMLRLFYVLMILMPYMFHLSGNNRRDSHFTGS